MSKATKVFDKYIGDNEADKRALEAERLIVSVTEQLLREMDKLSFSKAELARKIGRSKSYVTALLTGSRNMTLRTLSGISYHLGMKVKLVLVPHEPLLVVESDAQRYNWDEALFPEDIEPMPPARVESGTTTRPLVQAA